MRRLLPLLLAWLLAAPALLAAQSSVSGTDADLLRAVMPGADRFEPKSGDPPVIRAYEGQRHLGFVFLTRDIPPEQLGYSGPVEAVVGMSLDGTITGARVTEYNESYRSSMGDFLRRPGVQEQFRGKGITDPFLVNGDVERVTRATISTQALARGIRDAGRRVAEAYADEMEGVLERGPVALEELSWFEMRTRGILKRILIESPEGHLDISMTWLPDDSIAEFFVGENDVARIHAAAERWDLGDPTFILYALEGPRLRFFLRDHWHVAQDGDTLDLAYEQVYSLGLTEEGRVAPESVLAGVFMLDDRVDLSRPFDLLYDLEGHEGYYGVRFEALEPEAGVVASAGEAPEGGGAAAPDAPDTVAEARAGTEGAADGAAGPSPGAGAGGESPDSAPPADARADAVPPAASGEAPPRVPPPVDFTRVQEESELAHTLAGTDWGRVARLGAVLALALLAFFLKRTGLRYLALGATVLVLGFLDGDFLSISHVTAGIWVGPGVYLRDVPLLILVAATVLTTLVWGRVFCGFLCPFGALQDLLERVVPTRFRVRVPWSVHLPALKLKYLVLAAILVPAILGSHRSLYQYAEPFGTVFFLSPSALLWAIAAVFLVGAAFIPRFYCRYACPLGAGLALVSFLAPSRIRRVEQCDPCRVCEQDCPTGAIQGPSISFAECVRCNRCETNLREEAGACRHDMAHIRSRLVQIETERSRAGV